MPATTDPELLATKGETLYTTRIKALVEPAPSPVKITLSKKVGTMSVLQFSGVFQLLSAPPPSQIRLSAEARPDVASTTSKATIGQW